MIMIIIIFDNKFFLEYFFVHITLENPMQNPINLNNIMLDCEHISQSNDENNSTSINELTINEDKTQSGKSTNNGEPQMMRFDNFDLETLPEVSFDALEKKTVMMVSHLWEMRNIK